MIYSVLIVDDNASLANLYQIVFERAGHQVHRVSSGPEALDYLTGQLPDVILLDVMMPEMDGVEVCRRIRATYPQHPPSIVIYTANNRPDTREMCLAAGADLFLSKSLSLFELPDQLAKRLPSQAE